MIGKREVGGELAVAGKFSGPGNYVGLSGLREEAVVGVFGVDADFDCVSVRRDVFLPQWQRLAARDADLELD